METANNNDNTATVKESKAQYWQRQFEQWQTSNLTQPEFCKRNDLNYTTFSYWRSRLSTTNKKFKPSNIQTVTLPAKMNAITPSIRLRLSNGTLIEIPTTVDVQTLKQIFHCLGLTQ